MSAVYSVRLPNADHKGDEETAAQATPSSNELKSYLPPSDDFAKGKKILITVVLCFMTLALTFSSSAYVSYSPASSAASLEIHFHTSSEVILLGIALYVLGFAVGPLLFGPLAYLIGGRPVYVGTYLCFTAFAFGASEAPDVTTLIVLRFFMGVFGSSSLNNTAGTIGEMVQPADIGSYMIWYALSVAAGAGLGPVFGSLLDHRVGFRWNLRVQAIFIALTTVACVLLVPETGSPALKRMNDKAENGVSSRRALVAATCKRALFGPFLWLFAGIRSWSEESASLMFISLLVGFMSSVPVMGLRQRKYETEQRARLSPGSRLPPESKLEQMLWAAVLVPIGLFLFAWTAPFPRIHWIAPAIGMALFGLGNMVIYVSLIPYMVEYAGQEAQLALAASTFTRAAFGCGFPLFSQQMYDRLTIQGATSLLAGISLLLVAMPWILKRNGSAIRAKSRLVRHTL